MCLDEMLYLCDGGRSVVCIMTAPLSLTPNSTIWICCRFIVQHMLRSKFNAQQVAKQVLKKSWTYD